MPDPIKIQIDTNAAAVAGGLTAFPAAMAAAIAKAMDRQNELTVGYIQRTRLSRRGPDTLGVITNRLRGSLRPSLAQVSGTTVDSAIGSNVRYAAAHEYGFSGEVTVREHRARHHALDVFNIRGRTLRGWQIPGIGRGKRTTRIAEGFVTVRQHAMQMNIPARAPIRTGILERTADYTRAVSAAITSAWQSPS